MKRATGRYVSPLDLIFWPTGLLANALTRYYELWEDKEDVLKALPEKYHKNFVIKISREKNKIYALPLSTHADGRPSIAEIIYLT